MKLNMKCRYLISIGFLVFGFVMQAADYPNVSDMSIVELNQLKNYLAYKDELVELAKGLIGSYYGFSDQSKKALKAVQEYCEVEKMLEGPAISDDSSEADEQACIESRKDLQSDLNDIRSRKEKSLQEHRELKDSYFATRDEIVKFYNAHSKYRYNARIAENKSFTDGIELIRTFIGVDNEAMKVFNQHQPELQLQQCNEYCMAIEPFVKEVQEYIRQYKKDEKNRVAIYQKIKMLESSPMQEGANTIVIKDALNKVIITLNKNKRPIIAPKFTYSSTVNDWVLSTDVTMDRLGYNDPDSEKYRLREGTRLVHAFSRNVDACIHKCGKIGRAEVKSGGIAEAIYMRGFITDENGNNKQRITVEYFIDKAGTCFHRNLKTWIH